MVPALRHGDRVRLEARRPSIGDVVLVRQPRGLVLHRLVWGPPFDFRGVWRSMADRSPRWDAAFDPDRWIGTVRRRGGAWCRVIDAGFALRSLALGLLTRARGMFSR